MYLIDSERVVDFLKGMTESVDLLNNLSPHGMAISVLTYGEVLDGIYFGRDPVGNEAAFRDFLEPVDILPLSIRVAERFARLRGELRRTGLIIGDMDLLIGATAIEGNHSLVTRNLGHYDRLPGLTLYRA